MACILRLRNWLQPHIPCLICFSRSQPLSFQECKGTQKLRQQAPQSLSTRVLTDDCHPGRRTAIQGVGGGQ